MQNECDLQTKVPAFLSKYAADVELIDSELGTTGRVLDLRIGNVHAPIPVPPPDHAATKEAAGARDPETV